MAHLLEAHLKHGLVPLEREALAQIFEAVEELVLFQPEEDRLVWIFQGRQVFAPYIPPMILGFLELLVCLQKR